jgi:alcohol dehydrogenase
MRELIFIEPGRLEWRDTAEPELESAEEAIVRPIVASNCDLDTAIVRGDAPLPGPFAIGHEFIAEVIEVGDDVSSFAKGQKVIVPWKISCGACESCRRGVTPAVHRCPRWRCSASPSGVVGALGFRTRFASHSPTICSSKSRLASL